MKTRWLRPESRCSALDASSIYEVPIRYHEQGFDREVLRHFGLEGRTKVNLSRWTEIMRRVQAPEGEVQIAVVGKYTNLLDAYKSLAEALTHGGIANNVRVRLNWLESEVFENGAESFDALTRENRAGGTFGEKFEAALRIPDSGHSDQPYKLIEGAPHHLPPPWLGYTYIRGR